MEIKELNKQQLLLLAILISFVTSIATGITTVSLMEGAPEEVTTPVREIVRQTVEKIVPVEIEKDALSAEEKKLLEELKAIQPLNVSLYLKGATEKDDKLLGTGLLLGENKVIIASKIAEPKEGEVYVLKSVLGEKEVLKLTQQEDFTIVELAVSVPVEEKEDGTEGDSNTETDEETTNPNGTNTTTETGTKTQP